MNGDDAVRFVALAGWLALALGAYASYRLEWKKAVRDILVWGAIFAAVTLVIGFVLGG